MIHFRLAGGLIALALSAPLQAQDPIWYSVSFPNAVHHEAEITVLFPDLEEGTLELRMSRTSPGRYALHEFGKNVYDVQVEDGMQNALAVERPDAYTWAVDHPAGDVRVTYTLFGDHASGTYTGIDRSQAHLSMPATLMWARGLDDRPVRVDFRPPDGQTWQVATQLEPGDRPFAYTAPNLQYLMDSPTHLGNFDLREWTVGPQNRYTIRLAVDHDGTDQDMDALEAGVRAIVDATGDIWGGFPAFDFGTYTFVAAYLPWVTGDGMEHRNSTSLTSTGNIGTSRFSHLATVAHEFFHAWNVERVRPAALEPFDYERVNMSGELWFAEGFTSYYTDLILRRAGLMDTRNFAGAISGGISTVTTSPGRNYRSPVEMSMHAPFVDRAVSIDPNNHGNTFISYYTWGSVVGLALDLTLRDRFGAVGLSLDAYMRAAWERFGLDETPYTVDDLEVLLGDLTGDPSFAEEFFDLYIRGRLVPDFAELLEPAGMVLRAARPDAAWIGSPQITADGEGAIVSSYTRVGSPLYEAGVDRGDRILTLDGESVLSANDLSRIVGQIEPGDEMTIRFESRGTEQEATVTPVADPQVEVALFERVERPLTRAIQAFRASWLDGTP